MKKLTKVKMRLILLLILGANASVAQVIAGDQKDADKILENIQLFSKFYTTANYDALANSYCENGMILPPGSDIIKGREAIKQRWVLPEGIKVPFHKITPIEISINGNWAYDIGYYEGTTLKKNGDKSDFKGKYVIIWKKEDGDWKIYSDIWNRINN
ncbi:MAG TPA: DUF4440 domain-containing protein [Flavobacteriaceae bacterium]|mgnify:CR=1 FL=1|nr:DUF4440 domain-containing protein [Flavobacteriaceae bacterium]MCB9213453.1 DUF4440 domain-containing protein [Alteromonas sp.]HPF12244.1 DUF4440 domain-containing protein [Flavobacteriaceae bacterium]HQU22471.1 DUF4440 domain-containing protein [Flavobacteriaceae bacterium]HQU65868.1 DUF4440 domain-containing protein [Flavobacteriaceae bacterium]